MKLTKKLIIEMIEEVMNEGKPMGMGSKEFHDKVIADIFAHANRQEVIKGTYRYEKSLS